MNDLVHYLRSNSNTNGVFVCEESERLYALLYADDVSSFAETASNLQNITNCVADFSDNLGMKINLEKSKVMVFRNGGRLRHYEKWT